MALNLPYDTHRKGLWEYFARPVDRYKSNYDNAFGLEWNESLGTWEIPADADEKFMQAGKLDGQPE